MEAALEPGQQQKALKGLAKGHLDTSHGQHACGANLHARVRTEYCGLLGGNYAAGQQYAVIGNVVSQLSV